MSTRAIIHLLFGASYLLIGSLAFFETAILWSLALVIPVHAVAIVHSFQKKHTILRNYPLVGALRYFFESFRPEFRQYFFESDLDGKPFNRRQRSIVYQRAKNVKQTVPFGMQVNPEEIGYEWFPHTMFPVHIEQKDLRVTIGGKACTVPYSASILNISAMSYGALSKTAVRALNEGARMGGFAHNTGEGGISPYHLEAGGDLIWQIGTGYFGCRDLNGNFDADLFRQNAGRPQVKMIELKLSQGAKPGHGGILPARKNTPEIAAIRNVEPYTSVLSPPAHTAFHDAESMCHFIQQLRQLSGGKPVGFKLCVGSKREFKAVCAAMKNTGIYPDFIVVDGAEGGTGAAPLEFTDNIGMPLNDALAFVHTTLKEYGIRDELKLMAAGKIITGADIMKMMALGADACYSARGMMFALGCIQALQCDSGKCPVGVATQDPKLYKGLDVTDKKVRVANFHGNTVKSMIEMMEACGFKTTQDITADKVFRRIGPGKAKSFQEIYFSKPAPGHRIKEESRDLIMN